MKVFKSKYRYEFWERLPGRAYLLFIISVFFLFSIFGFAGDLLNNLNGRAETVILWCVYSGIVASGFAYSFTRNRKAFPFVIIFMLIFMIFPYNNFFPESNPSGKHFKLIFDAVGIYSTVVLGYVFFLIFITREGIKQLRMKTEFDLAESMHQVLVPPVKINNERMEIFGLSHPAFEIGGDLIDFIENEKYSTAYIADVSGHGIDAGLLMGMFKAVIHSRLSEDYPLVDSIRDANNVLINLKKPNMFITCSAIRIYPDNKAEFLTAGHPPVLHYHHDTNSVTQLLIKQIPVTVKENFRFTSSVINYSAGDIFVLTTDGIVEVMDKKGNLFGLQRVEELLLNNHVKSSSELFEIIFDHIKSFGVKTDDQSAVIIKFLK